MARATEAQVRRDVAVRTALPPGRCAVCLAQLQVCGHSDEQSAIAAGFFQMLRSISSPGEPPAAPGRCA